jgi:hypothetical protein
VSGEAQSFSPAALQPDRLFPIGLVDVRVVQHNENLNVMMFEVDLTDVSANIVGVFLLIFYNRDSYFFLIVDCLVDRPSSIILE